MKRTKLVPIALICSVALILVVLYLYTVGSYNKQEKSCQPSWNCSEWSECSRTGKTIGVETRTCSDSNFCNITSGKPDESIACSLPRIYDLSDLPYPFVNFSNPNSGSQFGTLVVVGNDASKEDAISGIDVASNLGGNAFVELDTEVKNKTSQPLILIGGPNVNTLVAEVLNLTYPISDDTSDFPVNSGVVRIVNNAFGGNYPVLIVAGIKSCQTKDAAFALKNYDKLDLTGDTFIEPTSC